MSNVERAEIDARFGILMASMAEDSVFMHYYKKLVIASVEDDLDSGAAG